MQIISNIESNVDYTDVTDYKAAHGIYPINCSLCNRSLYSDKQTSEHISELIERGLDNPFVCDDCQREYEELAFESR